MPFQTLEMFTFAVGELLAHQRHHADIIENTERLTAWLVSLLSGPPRVATPACKVGIACGAHAHAAAVERLVPYTGSGCAGVGIVPHCSTAGCASGEGAQPHFAVSMRGATASCDG